ncbi:MAG: HNH endonuclease [bacterium]|nr:HNH endonuclease [bacterium]
MVSDMGRVLALPMRIRRGWGVWVRPPRMLSLKNIGTGYKGVGISREGRVWQTSVHRLVLTAFIGPCPQGMEASHLNGVRDDNRLENLVWETRSQNHARKKGHGTNVEGERHPHSRLTESAVREIRARPHSTPLSELAEEFGVCRAAICLARSGKTWKHV